MTNVVLVVITLVLAGVFVLFAWLGSAKVFGWPHRVAEKRKQRGKSAS